MPSFTELSNAIMSTDTSTTTNTSTNCSAAVKCSTHGQAVKSVITETETYLKDGKGAYYGCQKKANNGDTCSRHTGAKTLVMFIDIKKDGELLSQEHPYIQKHMPKYLEKQGKSKISPTSSMSGSNIIFEVDISSLDLSDEEKKTITAQIQETAIQFIAKYNEDKLSSPGASALSIEEDDTPIIADAPIEPELSTNDGECDETIQTLITKSEKMDETDSGSDDDDDDDEEDDSEEVPCQKSDDDGDAEECLELTEIQSKKGDAYGLDENDNSVYNPDSGEVIGKLINVADDNSSISYEDDDYCVGENFDIDETTYIKCVLTERLYDSDSKKLIGVLGKKKDGSFKIRKSKK